MSLRTLDAFDLKSMWPDSYGASGTLVVTIDRGVVYNSVQYPATQNAGGALRSIGFHWESAITVTDGLATCAAISGLPETDSAIPAHTAHYSIYVYDSKGKFREKLSQVPFHLHESLNGGTTVFTWEQWVVAQQFKQGNSQLPMIGDRTTFQAMLDAATHAHASDITEGTTFLSEAPASASIPIAEGSNSTRLMSSLTLAAMAALTAITGSIKFATDGLRGLYYKTLAGIWTSITGRIDPLNFNAAGVSTQTTTTGSHTAGATTINVASSAGYVANQGIFIAQAGAAGAYYIGTVSSVPSSTSIIVTPAISATITSGKTVQHDDTVAMNAAILAAVAAGGVDVWGGNGYFRCNGTFNPTTNSILHYGAVRVFNTDEQVAVRLVGASWPFAGLPPSKKGFVIDATDASGVVQSGTQPAVLAPKAFGTTLNAISDFTYLRPYFKNVRFIVRENPTITVLQLHNAITADLQNVSVSVDSGTVAVEPTTATALGIIMPGVNNDTQQSVDHVFVQGFAIGMAVSEHIIFNNAQLRRCKTGLLQQLGYHVNSGHLLIEQCGTFIEFESLSRVKYILDIERNDIGGVGVNWYGQQGTDIKDPNNFGIGSLTYQLTQSSVAPLAGFCLPMTLNFGANGATGVLGRKLSVVPIDAPADITVLYRTVNQNNLVDGTPVPVIWNGAITDPGDAHDTTSTASSQKMTFTRPGWRRLDASLRFAASATGQRGAAFRKNGTTTLYGGVLLPNSGASLPTIVNIGGDYWFEAGDYVEAMATTYGVVVDLEFVDGIAPYFTVKWSTIP